MTRASRSGWLVKLLLLLLFISLTTAGGLAREKRARKKSRPVAERNLQSLYPKREGPIGYGIFQVMHWRHLERRLTANIDHPYLAGIHFFAGWSEIEPEEGRYNWAPINRVIQPWAAARKKGMISIKTAQRKGHDVYSASNTPRWVFEAGAKKIVVTPKKAKRFPQQTVWPIYWDEVYLEKYRNFVQALARKYDGHPAIELIYIGTGKGGKTKVAGQKRVVTSYKRAGYTPKRWTDTIKKIVDIYQGAFKRTPLALLLTLFEKEDSAVSYQWMEELAAYAAARRIQIHHVGVSGNERFLRRPFARIFHKYSQQTKTGFSADNPISPTTEKNQRRYGDIETLGRYLFGGTRGIPLTYISYMQFYVRDIEAATKGGRHYDQQFEEVVKYVYRRLRREK